MPRTGENIYKRKDGRWEARYILFYDENGKAKYRYLYAKTYTEVKNKLFNEQAQTINFISAKSNVTYAKYVHSSMQLKRMSMEKLNSIAI